jgi:hypothetical protein
MFSEAELVGEQGSKGSKKNAKMKPARNADGNMFTVCANIKIIIFIIQKIIFLILIFFIIVKIIIFITQILIFLIF